MCYKISLNLNKNSRWDRMTNLLQGKKFTFEDVEIVPAFPCCKQKEIFEEDIQRARKIVSFFLQDKRFFANKYSFLKWVMALKPMIRWTTCPLPGCFSLFFLSYPLRTLPTETFIFEMIKEWLLPHQEIKILLFHHLDFYFHLLPTRFFFAGEIKILIQMQRDWNTVQKTLPHLKKRDSTRALFRSLC